MASAHDTSDQTSQVESDADAAAGADDENAALIAELDAAQGKAKVAKPAKAKADKPAAEPSATDEEPAEGGDTEEADDQADDQADAEIEDDGDDEDADDDEDEEEDSDGDDGDELDEEAGKDPALKKRLDAVRRTEQRQRQRLEQERAEFDRQRSTWQSETQQLRAKVSQIEGLISRAKIDPAAVLEALGLGPEDMEYAGTLCYARGKTAAADPKYRQAAEKAIRDRELAEKTSAADKRIADLEAKLEAKETAAAAERELDAYFARVLRKVTDAHPITARLVAKRPKAARAELERTAAELSTKLGRLPKVAELLVAHEKREAHALKLRGIKPPGPKVAKPQAEETTETTTRDKSGAGAKPAKGKKPGAKPARTEGDDEEITIPTVAELARELAAAQRN